MSDTPLKKAAIYIRVSTDAQREEGYSIEAQKEMLTAYLVSKRIKNYEYYIVYIRFFRCDFNSLCGIGIIWKSLCNWQK